MPAARDNDAYLTFVTTKVVAICNELHEQPHYAVRLRDNLDAWLWSLGVDSFENHGVRKDGWLPSGAGLNAVHLGRTWHTAMAAHALLNGTPGQVTREHVVPRNRVKKILTEAPAKPERARQILMSYSIVALVHDDEVPLLAPQNDMPPAWYEDIQWADPHVVLPDPWARYAHVEVLPPQP